MPSAVLQGPYLYKQSVILTRDWFMVRAIRDCIRFLIRVIILNTVFFSPEVFNLVGIKYGDAGDQLVE